LAAIRLWRMACVSIITDRWLWDEIRSIADRKVRRDDGLPVETAPLSATE
jgi:hypothetical protein